MTAIDPRGPERARRLGRASAVSLIPVVLALASSGASAQSKTYTTDADFDLGTLLDVNHDFPNNDQLQLDAIDVPFALITVPASGRGTIVIIDATTGQVLGEYRSSPGPTGGPSLEPSRTTMDVDGNAWAGNERSAGPDRSVHRGTLRPLQLRRS